jgi:hypothetical protein
VVLLLESRSPSFYASSSHRLVIEFDEVGCVGLIGIFPSIIAFGVTLPFDQILQCFGPPPGPMGAYLLHFIFFFPINQIRWRPSEVGAV